MNEEDKQKVKSLVAIAAGMFALAGGRDQYEAVVVGKAFADKADEAGLLDGLGLEEVLP